jgi:hypothetical protein
MNGAEVIAEIRRREGRGFLSCYPMEIQGRAWYMLNMSPMVKEILQQVESWPVEDQEELADVAREIKARRAEVYRLSDEERTAVRLGMEAARRGDFASDDEINEFYRIHRSA